MLNYTGTINYIYNCKSFHLITLSREVLFTLSVSNFTIKPNRQAKLEACLSINNSTKGISIFFYNSLKYIKLKIYKAKPTAYKAKLTAYKPPNQSPGAYNL